MPFFMNAVSREFLACIRKQRLQRISVYPQLRKPFSQIKKMRLSRYESFLTKQQNLFQAAVMAKRQSFLPPLTRPSFLRP